MMRRLLLILILLLSAREARAQAWSGLIDPSRAIDWSRAGCCIDMSTGAKSGLPTLTQCTLNPATVPTGWTPNWTNNVVMPSGLTDWTDASNVNLAIQQCAAQAGPGNHKYVQVGAGEFYIVGGITWGSAYSNIMPFPGPFHTQANYVTLRGMGADQTIFNGRTAQFQGDCNTAANAICILPNAEVGDPSQTAYSPYAGGCSWTSGYARGSTTITVTGCVSPSTSVPVLPTQGTIIYLDQNFDDVGLAPGDVATAGTCTSSGTTATCVTSVALSVLQQRPEWHVGACVGVAVGVISNNYYTTVNASGYYNTSLLTKWDPHNVSAPVGTPPQTCIAPILSIGTDSVTGLANFTYTLPVSPPWSASTYFGAGLQITSSVSGTLYVFRATAAGTTGTTIPAFPATLNATVVDGGVTWTNIGTQAAIGTNLPPFTQCFNPGTNYPGPLVGSAPGIGPGRPAFESSNACWASVDTGGVYSSSVTGITSASSLTNGRICPDEYYNSALLGIFAGHPQMPSCRPQELSWRPQAELKVALSVTPTGPVCQPQNTQCAATITLDAPVYANQYRASQNPGVFWFTQSALPHDIGIESITLNATLDTGNIGGGTINSSYCYNCWIRGVRMIDGSRNHIWNTTGAFHNTIRDSYFYGTKRGASQSYGIETYNLTSDLLWENNLFVNTSTPVIHGSSIAVVASYNFALGDNSNTYYLGGPMFANHQSAALNLFEGNDAAQDWYDNIHGTVWGPSTHFRSRMRGQQSPPKYTNLAAFGIASFSRGTNVIGSILGTATNNVFYYKIAPVSGGCGTNPGNGSVFCGSSDAQNFNQNSDDRLVDRSMFLWGNFDPVSNGVRWCGTGSETIPGTSNTCQSVGIPGNTGGSEIPGAFTYINAQFIPTSHVLPVSLYLTSKPGFFATKWGMVPWPPIGPDINNPTPAFDNVCWFVLPPAVCNDPNHGANMAYEIPAQVAQVNAPLDMNLDQIMPITSASFSGTTVTLIGTFYSPTINQTGIIRGVSPSGYNGVFSILATSAPYADLNPAMGITTGTIPANSPVNSSNGSTFQAVTTRLNPNGETTMSASGQQTLYSAGGLIVYSPCGAAPPGASPCANNGNNNLISTGCCTGQSTGWNVYMRPKWETTGKFCKQNLTGPLTYGVAFYQTTDMIRGDGSGAPGTCVEPPTTSTATGNTITLYMPNNPGGPGGAGQFIFPMIQVFNADLYYNVAAGAAPSMFSGLGFLTGGGKLSLSTVVAARPARPPVVHRPVHRPHLPQTEEQCEKACKEQHKKKPAPAHEK